MSAPMPSPMHAPQQALLPPSLEEAALKLEAGHRNALRLEEELDEWAVAALATSQKPVEVHQATDLQAWQEEALQLRRGGLLLLSIWEKRPLTELTNHAVLLMAVLLLWLLLGVSGSGEQPAPEKAEEKGWGKGSAAAADEIPLAVYAMVLVTVALVTLALARRRREAEEKHVDVARQVDVFEKEMRADDKEIAQLSLEEQKAEALYSEEARPVLAIMMEAAKKMVSKVSQWVGSATAAPVTVLAKLKAC